jgi:hypothetical protein
MEIVLAAIVVLDDFDGVPVTVRQSPTAIALCVWVAVCENVVVPVQLTVVCPVLAFWTSMDDPVIEATLPLAAPPDPLGGVAAPALAVRPMRTVMLSRAPPTGPYQRRRCCGVLMSSSMFDAAFRVVPPDA